MIFKVWNKNKKEWADDKNFYIDSDGDLHQLDTSEDRIFPADDWFIPVFSIGKINGIDYYEGDIFETLTGNNVIIIHDSNGSGDSIGVKMEYLFGTAKGLTIAVYRNFLLKNRMLGNKFENPELLNIGD